jgi:phosphoserine phosphatase
MATRDAIVSRRYLVASDFDRTLSFNDSGLLLSELLGVPEFEAKVAGLARISLVQQGAELAYLLRHDPEFRRVRREHLTEVGQRVRLKRNVAGLARILSSELDGCRFSFFVVSAAPREVVVAALDGIVPADRVFGTEFEYEPSTGEIAAIRRAPAGYGKVTVLGELQRAERTRPDRTVYIGDGSSDLHVMQHVNGREGYTIAVSESRDVARIARRTVLSDNALSVLVPILEDLLGWEAPRIRELFSSVGLTLQEWDKVRTDRLTFHEPAVPQ